MDTVLSAGAVLLFTTAALTDLRARLIPNWIPASLGLLFAAAAVADPVRHSPLWSVGAALLVFAPLLLCFAFGKLGGGDVKLLSAAALWAGWEHLPELLAVTALTGGVLALIVLLRIGLRRAAGWLFLAAPCAATAKLDASLDRLLRTRTADALPLGETGLPYGIAIAAGGVSVLLPFGSSGT